MKRGKRVTRAARQLFRFCLVDGVLDGSRVHQVVSRIAASKRREAFALLAVLQRLVRLDHDRHTASVQTAVPLTDPLRKAVRADLSRVYGPGLDCSFAENPELIGGMRIRVASDLYDGSVRARLTALETRL